MERERREREKEEKQRQKQLERERRQKERAEERERQEQLERERLEKEKKERESEKRLERERREKERLEKIKTLETDDNTGIGSTFKSKRFRNLRNSYDKDEDDEYYARRMRNLTYRHEDNLRSSNLSESFINGKPTKIKVYRCVVWKNLDPEINEDTIRLILNRSGSHLLRHGGVIMKLGQSKSLNKSNKGFEIRKK